MDTLYAMESLEDIRVYSIIDIEAGDILILKNIPPHIPPECMTEPDDIDIKIGDKYITGVLSKDESGTKSAKFTLKELMNWSPDHDNAEMELVMLIRGMK